MTPLGALLSLILSALVLVLLSVPSVRRIWSRHRLVLALLSPPLLPFCVIVILFVYMNFKADMLVLVLLSYVAGLVAFTFVTTLQDASRSRRSGGRPDR